MTFRYSMWRVWRLLLPLLSVIAFAFATRDNPVERIGMGVGFLFMLSLGFLSRTFRLRIEDEHLFVRTGWKEMMFSRSTVILTRRGTRLALRDPDGGHTVLDLGFLAPSNSRTVMKELEDLLRR